MPVPRCFNFQIRVSLQPPEKRCEYHTYLNVPEAYLRFLPIYRPWILSVLDTITYSFLYTTRILNKEEKVLVSLEDTFFDNPELPSTQGQLFISPDNFKWYSVRLVIKAIFTPFTGVLHRHVWFVGLLFVLASMASLNLLLAGMLAVRYRDYLYTTFRGIILSIAPLIRYWSLFIGHETVSEEAQQKIAEIETDKDSSDDMDAPLSSLSLASVKKEEESTSLAVESDSHLAE